MELIFDNGIYYEFIPFNDANFDDDGNFREQVEVLGINEVEEGVDYAIILSTNAGAWRYLIGDTIKFLNKQRGEIIITGRTKHFISICGEHLSVDNMNRAIELLENDLNVDIKEFTLMGIRYERLFAHKWYLGTDDHVDPEEACTKLDTYLSNLNDDYRVERLEAIKDVFVHVIPTKAFYDFMKLKGKVGSANKFPRVLKNDRITEWEDFLKKEKYI